MRKYPKSRLTDLDCNEDELRVKLKKIRREKRALRAEVSDLRAQMTDMVRPTRPSQIDLVLIKASPYKDGTERWNLVHRQGHCGGTEYDTMASMCRNAAFTLVDGTEGINGVSFLYGDPRDKETINGRFEAEAQG